MTLIRPRPWWRFWPVVCWRHLRLVPKNDVCPACVPRLAARYEARMAGADRQRAVLLPPAPRKVYLLTAGDGEAGNPWEVVGIYATRAAAERAKWAHDQPRRRPDGSRYYLITNAIEEWEVHA